MYKCQENHEYQTHDVRKYKSQKIWTQLDYKWASFASERCSLHICIRNMLKYSSPRNEILSGHEENWLGTLSQISSELKTTKKIYDKLKLNTSEQANVSKQHSK